MTEDSRQKLLSELQGMIRDLRPLNPAKGHGVSSCLGGSLRDSRILKSRPRFGPFGSINEFHLWLRDYLQPEKHSTWGDEREWEEIKRMATQQDKAYSPPVFTHGDLNPSNILVRDGKIAVIIDWEIFRMVPSLLGIYIYMAGKCHKNRMAR
ncbi:hypothetical protein BDV19DRAFT_391028 [Aspergillus venezuelensis]